MVKVERTVWRPLTQIIAVVFGVTVLLTVLQVVSFDVEPKSANAKEMSALLSGVRYAKRIMFPASGPLDGMAEQIEKQTPLARLFSGDAFGDTSVCTNVHPKGDSPDMLHVVFASDKEQLEGVMASMASVMTSADSGALTLHMMVHQRLEAQVKMAFGILPQCASILISGGNMIRVHVVDEDLIQKSMAKVSESVQLVRGHINGMENFARFYMDLVLDPVVVVYLDADTIVQADLRALSSKLVESKLTAGFVERDVPVQLDSFLKRPESCKESWPPNWEWLKRQEAWNVGVFVVDLARWKVLKYAERVEAWVKRHNDCSDGLWVGGSQPPLLLSFVSRPDGEPVDYVTFEAEWNAADLGWRTGMSPSQLKLKKILHWNGPKKPWKKDGLYKQLWKRHREKFDLMMKMNRGKVASRKSDDARRICPNVSLLDKWSKVSCNAGFSYTCADDELGVQTKRGCEGLFAARNQAVACREGACALAPGKKPSSSCNLMILSTFFTTVKDWQRTKSVKQDITKIKDLYSTTYKLGLNVTVVYDDLPDNVLSFKSDRFLFEQVAMTDYDTAYGVNDVRYFFFQRLISKSSWQYIFILDAFDVKVQMNPCPALQANVLYVGMETERLKGHPWMKARFQSLGDKYMPLYESVAAKAKIVNCGILGGSREIMLNVTSLMLQVITDPELEVRTSGKPINVNMAALNYIYYKLWKGPTRSNSPVHSVYKRYQSERKSVWFVHK